MKLAFDAEQRNLALDAFNRLKAEGKIAPSMRDQASPFDWFDIQDAGNRERMGVAGWSAEDRVPPEEADYLTALYAREALDRDMSEAAAHAAEAGVPIACLMIDLDHFKQINDKEGHSAGDETLRQVARRIQETVTGVGRAYRYGGDEFAAILIGVPREEGLRVAEAIKEAVASLPPVGSEEISVSVGLAASADCEPTEWPRLLEKADEALLLAKRERLRPREGVSLSTECTVTRRAGSNRVEGRLGVKVTNNSSSKIKEWAVTVEFPKPFIENPGSVALFVGETETHHRFRTSQANFRGLPLYPGDKHLAMTLDFFVDEAVHTEKRLFDRRVKIAVLANSYSETFEEKFGQLVDED